MFKSAMFVGALAMLSACGQEPTDSPVEGPTAKNPVDTTAIARAIEARLERGVPLRVRVRCQSDIEWEPGQTFKCVVKSPDGRSKATVTLGEAGDAVGGPSSGTGRTAQGEYSWKLD